MMTLRLWKTVWNRSIKEMATNATNAGKLRELSEEQQETQQKLDEKMDRWVYLNDLAEQIEAQKE